MNMNIFNDDRDVYLTEEEKQMLGKQGICERCGSPNGVYCIDPYQDDVNNVEILVCLCDDCYDDLAGDI